MFSYLYSVAGVSNVIISGGVDYTCFASARSISLTFVITLLLLSFLTNYWIPICSIGDAEFINTVDIADAF